MKRQYCTRTRYATTVLYKMKTVCTTVLYPNNRNTDMGGWGYNIAVLFWGVGL